MKDKTLMLLAAGFKRSVLLYKLLYKQKMKLKVRLFFDENKKTERAAFALSALSV